MMKRLVFRIAVIISVLIPLGVATYEVLVSGKDSVVFLENYPPALGYAVLIYYGILLTGGLIWLIAQLKSLIRLKNENTQYELMHLNGQVNPHFFFNVLNNLYGLTAKNPPKAQELILKLSEMMRYSLHEGKKKHVPLAGEIRYLKNYIELHRMRYHKKISVDFISDAEEGLTVTPLLFIILLENAFKHGVENLRENAFVNVYLAADSHRLHFRVENNFDPQEVPADSGRIGLENLKRRLTLLYPGRHQLKLTTHENVYQAELILERP